MQRPEGPCHPLGTIAPNLSGLMAIDKNGIRWRSGLTQNLGGQTGPVQRSKHAQFGQWIVAKQGRRRSPDIAFHHARAPRILHLPDVVGPTATQDSPSLVRQDLSSADQIPDKGGRWHVLRL